MTFVIKFKDGKMISKRASNFCRYDVNLDMAILTLGSGRPDMKVEVDEVSMPDATSLGYETTHIRGS